MVKHGITLKGIRTPQQIDHDHREEVKKLKWKEELQEDGITIKITPSRKDLKIHGNVTKEKKTRKYTLRQAKLLKYLLSLSPNNVLYVYTGFFLSEEFPFEAPYTRNLFSKLKKEGLMTSAYDSKNGIYTYSFSPLIREQLNGQQI